MTARIDVGDSASTPAVGEDGSLFAVRPREGNRYDRPELVRVDSATNRIAATVALPSASRTYGVTGLVAARGLVWVAYPGRGLVRVDPASGTAREVRAAGRLVAVRSGSRLLLADPDKGVVRATMPAPGTRGAGMAVDGGLDLALRPGPRPPPAHRSRAAGQPLTRAAGRLSPATGAGRRTPRPGRAAGSGR